MNISTDLTLVSQAKRRVQDDRIIASAPGAEAMEMESPWRYAYGNWWCLIVVYNSGIDLYNKIWIVVYIYIPNIYTIYISIYIYLI